MTSVDDHRWSSPDLADVYGKYRPGYPPVVYDKIINWMLSSSSQSPGQDGGHGGEHVLEEQGCGAHAEEGVRQFNLAIDVGCGSGKTTVALCKFFHNVIGVDNSEAMLNEARKLSQGFSNVSYSIGSAHDLSFIADNSVDLITVGTALHWFDPNKFFSEACRILRPGGVLAAYGYTSGVVVANGQRIKEWEEIFWSEETLTKCGAAVVLSCTCYRYRSQQKSMEKYFSEIDRDDSLTLTHLQNVDTFRQFCKTASFYKDMNKHREAIGEPGVVEVMVERIKEAYNGELPSGNVININSEVFIIFGRKTRHENITPCYTA